MKHTELWETCDQCNKTIKQKYIRLEMDSDRIDLGDERVNMERDSWGASYRWCNKIWLKVEGVFCSVACVTKEFNKIIKEYERATNNLVDDLTTDLWGGAGPDCCIVRVAPAC